MGSPPPPALCDVQPALARGLLLFLKHSKPPTATDEDRLNLVSFRDLYCWRRPLGSWEQERGCSGCNLYCVVRWPPATRWQSQSLTDQPRHRDSVAAHGQRRPRNEQMQHVLAVQKVLMARVHLNSLVGALASGCFLVALVSCCLLERYSVSWKS